ncbi:MAG: DUF6445 family protein [Rhodospirillales bacterium]
MVLSTPYQIQKTDENSRNFKDYYDCRHFIDVPFTHAQLMVQALARKILHININTHEVNLITNLFKLASEQPANSQPHPHDDWLRVAAIVTLNTPEECSGGTAFYRKRNLGREFMPTTLANYDKVSDEVYSVNEAWEDGNSYFNDQYEKDWEILDILPMLFNQIVIYPGFYFYGTWHEHNAFKYYYRINQVMFFGDVDFDPNFWPA